jgi:hypothetical protein
MKVIALAARRTNPDGHSAGASPALIAANGHRKMPLEGQGTGGSADYQTQIRLPVVIRTKNGRVRTAVRTIPEGLGLINQELPEELRKLSRWTFARELLEVAARSGKKRDINAAVRQLRQALSNEGWLAE